jgi:maltose alpha-D-glucosyltransferase/alpha-amylase
MLGYVAFPEITAQPYPLTLAPYSFLWLELQPAAVRPATPTVDYDSSHVAIEDLSMTSLLEGPWLARVESLLPAYIVRQRWFGGKSKPIQFAQVISSTQIGNADAVIALVKIVFKDGSSDLYQLPLTLVPETQAAALKSSAPHTIIATLNQGEQPMVLLDATANPAFRSALLRMITAPSVISTGAQRSGETRSSVISTGAQRSGETRSSATPDLVASHADSIDPSAFANLPSRVGLVEQSNTSILYGETAILKLFRRLPSGINPDVEISRFLTDVAHFPHIPAYLGDLHRASDNTTIAFLQTFAPNEGDGWAWTLEELARFYESVANCPPPKLIPLATLAHPVIPTDELREHAAIYIDAARLLGQRTAQLHLALATPTDNSAFTQEPTTASNLAEDRNRIDEQINTSLSALQTALPKLPSDVANLASKLLSSRVQLAARAQALIGDPTHFGQRIRIHGDYHLGQLLRARTDFLIVDFEGEPAKPLEARRQKQSPLRDVAGMLRSFSYAARSALATFAQRYPEKYPTLELWATAWENAASNAFLAGYKEALAPNPTIIPDTANADIMLSALLLEKALYELLYELNNRPTWLSIPLSGLLTLTQDSMQA